MNTQQLRTFRIVAAAQSFTRAADLLDYAQSSVSAQVRGLEEELGTTLFHRFGRRFELTEAGRRLFEYGEKMLALEEEARAAVSGEASRDGVLRLGAPESLMTYRLPAVLRCFRDTYPGVRLFFRPMVDAELYSGVMDGKLDFAFLLQPPLRAESLHIEPLRTEPLKVVASGEHRLARRRKVGLGEIAGETILLTESGCGYKHLFERELARQGNYAFVKLEFSSVEAIKRCVMAGLGLAFLPEMAVGDEVGRGEMAVLHWEKQFSVAAQLIWHRQRWLSPADLEFIELCRTCFSEL